MGKTSPWPALYFVIAQKVGCHLLRALVIKSLTSLQRHSASSWSSQDPHLQTPLTPSQHWKGSFWPARPSNVNRYLKSRDLIVEWKAYFHQDPKPEPGIKPERFVKRERRDSDIVDLTGDAPTAKQRKTTMEAPIDLTDDWAPQDTPSIFIRSMAIYSRSSNWGISFWRHKNTILLQRQRFEQQAEFWKGW